MVRCQDGNNHDMEFENMLFNLINLPTDISNIETMTIQSNPSGNPALDKLIDVIRMEAWMTAPLTGRDVMSAATLTAIAGVPREEFVLKADRELAYQNVPLGIGFEQTISQPFIVAMMTDLLAPENDSEVLEIGTGSGYHAAVLAGLARKVYTVELIVPLAEQARARLALLGYKNIEIETGNGYFGWVAHAPYDAILLTAAVPEVPDQIIEQLKPGGRLVVPVGLPGENQELLLISRLKSGRVIRDPILPVAFGLLRKPDEESDLQED